MNRRIVILCVLLVPMLAVAQKVVVSGTVCDEQTGRPIPQANIAVDETGLSVVTNDDGFFTLKADEEPKALIVSHIGYESVKIQASKITDSQGSKHPDHQSLTIRLKPTSIQLQEVVVWTGNPRQLIDIAISKIPENYINQPELYHCFYRETAMKRQHYIYVAEGVVDMYKTAYNRSDARDRVAIVKGRRLLSPRRNDTLSVKVIGGPVQPIQLDIAKNLDFLLNPEDLMHYEFTMEPSTTVNGRLQYVVAIKPAMLAPWALYHGRFYIDRQTLAFTRAELSLDMSNREKATRFMLVRKPAGVRFRPKELSCLIDYRYEQGVTHISYIRNTFRFNCDWKRRLFATSFAATCEMVVTDKTNRDVQPIKGRESFDSRDAFYDRVDYFLDPAFWADYNIIEPTESLDQAVDKLVKRNLKNTEPAHPTRQ